MQRFFSDAIGIEIETDTIATAQEIGIETMKAIVPAEGIDLGIDGDLEIEIL